MYQMCMMVNLHKDLCVYYIILSLVKVEQQSGYEPYLDEFCFTCIFIL